jgi:hypothetical protein
VRGKVLGAEMVYFFKIPGYGFFLIFARFHLVQLISAVAEKVFGGQSYLLFCHSAFVCLEIERSS